MQVQTRLHDRLREFRALENRSKWANLGTKAGGSVKSAVPASVPALVLQGSSAGKISRAKPPRFIAIATMRLARARGQTDTGADICSSARFGLGSEVSCHLLPAIRTMIRADVGFQQQHAPLRTKVLRTKSL